MSVKSKMGIWQNFTLADMFALARRAAPQLSSTAVIHTGDVGNCRYTTDHSSIWVYRDQ